MRGLASKDIVGILLSIVGAAIFALLLGQQKIDIQNFQATDVLVILGVAVIAIVLVFYKKINEINDEMSNQADEQNRIEEKLKIYEQLIDMKADIKELQKRYER